MSNRIEEEEVVPAHAPLPRRPARAMLVLALTLGLAVGAVTGSLVVGPLLADPSGGGEGGSVPSGPALEAACEALFREWEVEMRPPAPAAVHSIENVVLNPAGSGGTRFLMATVGFGLRDPADAEQFTARDAEIRDIVIGVLGARSVLELSDVLTREVMKEEMRARVARLVGQRALVDIYFPQFVIQ
jgi:flagellar protein FliL